MIRYNLLFIGLLSLPLTVGCENQAVSVEMESPQTIVELIGPLQVVGNQIADSTGEPVALYGMSLFWSQWMAPFYNKSCIQWLRDDWYCTVIRAAMGIEHGGYLENRSEELAKIRTVVQACIDLGIYVIIDWHSHHAETQQAEAMAFFKLMAQLYGASPHVIYEIYNEPLDLPWSTVLKPYAEAVIAEIRSEDPDNLIIVGTPTWSQDVDVVALDPIEDVNVAYALHFYTGTHRQALRNQAALALSRNAALFVSEWGVSKADATGDIDYEETDRWLDFVDANCLSWCNWSVADKTETTSIVIPGASPAGNWAENDLTEAGRFVKSLFVARNKTLFEQLNKK